MTLFASSVSNFDHVRALAFASLIFFSHAIFILHFVIALFIYFAFCFRRLCIVSISCSFSSTPSLPSSSSIHNDLVAVASNANAMVDDGEHLHYHYDYNLPIQSASTIEAAAEAGLLRPSANAANFPVKRHDLNSRPRIGEVLVRDSPLYRQQTPAASLLNLRRNYWPLIDNTVSDCVLYQLKSLLLST